MADSNRAIEIVEITAMMSTEGGRRFIGRILESTQVFTSTFDLDTHKHAYNAGKRQVGLSLVSELEQACPDKYLQLLRERHDN
jgi:hypothetical protein